MGISPTRLGLITFLLAFSQLAQAAPDFGFESDATQQPPTSWFWQAADAVEVTASEGSEFPIYAEQMVTVEPNIGAQMLRLGTPKVKSEHQDRGVNEVTQSFAADRSQLTFAVRVFSLDHRGDDFFYVNLEDPSTGESFPVRGDNDQPFAIEFPQGRPGSCNQTPCAISLDVGRSNDFLDTGWRKFSILDLPSDGRQLTLTIGIEGGQNEAHASWMYVDSINQAPQASMNFNPGSQPGTVALESDYVVFDCLDSTDPDGDDTTCTWTASGAGLPMTTAVGKTAVFLFPEQGTASVTLTVSDGESTSSTTTGDGTTPGLSIQNGAPIVNALNVEVLPGHSIELLCRFADPGAQDTHTASFAISAPLSDEQIFEENVAALSSGYARAVLDATGLTPGTYSGECSVWDDEGDVGSDAFTVTVLDPVAFAAQTNSNTGLTSGAPFKRADASFIGALSSPEAVAVYELRLADGAPIPVGTEVNITVQVPVDFDIALLSGSTTGGPSVAPWVSAPWVSAPWVSAPWVNVPFVSLPFVSLPWVSLPFVSAPWVNAPWVSAPWVSLPLQTSPWVSADYQFQQLPLSQVGLAAPDGGQISGVDIAFDELGALGVGPLMNEPVRVKALSAEFGTRPEKLLVKTGPGEQGLYLAVIPQQGAFSSAPFNVQVEAAPPVAPEQLLGQQCSGQPLVTNPTQTPQVLVENASPRSLVITQRERLMSTFAMSAAEFEAWLAELLPYFNHPSVQAKVISVPSTWYDTADTNPCSVAEQNGVAEQIRALIQEQLASAGSIEYVQLMGSLDIVPPYYTPDETQTGYEGLYSADLWTRPATPLAVAIAQGNNITDAFYVDAEPQSFRARHLYIEDISVSRMVERPEEIAASALRFVQTDGIINLTSTQSTGYDFFIDGTESINRILQSLPAPTTTRNDNLWNIADLRCQFFGTGEGCTVSTLNAVNAHMSYNGGVTAAGFFDKSPSEVFASTESATMFADPTLMLNGVTFSIGCHSGLSVPDAWALPDNVGLPLNPARDWVQELGAWVGAYNFAYGDSEVADRGTEGIMPLVIQKFAEGETLGQALIKAKWQYGTGLYEFGVYDEKSLIALNLFGMPQARLGAVAPSLPEATGNAIGEFTSTIGTATFYLEELGDVTPVSAELEQQSNVDGTWFTLDGNAQGIVGRTLQPVLKAFETRSVAAGETTVHGVALRGGSYTEYLDQNPLLPVQQHDWVESFSEPQACVNTMTPTQIASVTRFDAPTGTLQSLILQPGQFQCTVPEADQGQVDVSGTFRIWNSADLELLHPVDLAADADFEPPVATQQDLVADPDSGVVTATLNATDNSGLREIVALVYRDLDGVAGGDGVVTSYSTGDIQGVAGPHVLNLPDAYQHRLAFQYIDIAGNILSKTLKGSLLRGIEVDILTSVFSNQGETTIVIAIESFTSLISPYLTVDFGDGTPALLLELVNADGSYAPEVEVAPDGSAIVTLTHSYAGITADSVTVVSAVRAAGAQGSDQATLFACSDPTGDALNPDGDIVSCSIGLDGDRIFIDLFVDGTISDTVQYRLRLGATNQKIQYSDGDVNGPNKLKAEVELVGTDGLRFSFRASQGGWNGGPFHFQLSTQDGVPSGAGAGTLDETRDFAFEPR
ncbi:MAG: hypothetical protein RIC89_17130 [Pseudomonadales bacterium]